MGRAYWKDDPEYNGNAWICSNCGEKVTSAIMGEPRYNFCPMCGRRMNVKTKKSAYLTREMTGHFMLTPTVSWIARDTWGNWITSGRTRKECEQNCRDLNYVPRR